MAEQTAGDYIVLGKLGSGAFGTVFQGRHQWQGSTVALKRLNLQNSDHIETARRELEPLLALRSTPHFNIVMFWESFVYQGSLWLVLEYCGLGTLNDFILATPQNTALNLRLMTNITAAVTFLHDREIVHRDLKPENILLSGTEENPVAKVGDFGLAKVCGDAFPNLFTDYYMSEECGSYIFLAPEVTEGHYTKKCDIFAMGVIFAAMITRATRKDEEGSEMLVVVVTENGKDLTIGEALRRNPNREAEISECLARAMLENTDNRALVDQDKHSQVINFKQTHSRRTHHPKELKDCVKSNEEEDDVEEIELLEDIRYFEEPYVMYVDRWDKDKAEAEQLKVRYMLGDDPVYSPLYGYGRSVETSRGAYRVFSKP
ncbi:hypothetical protein Bbelb_433560 [Branchiostoma belcheri]|nr:hypothetical protein Bbelb_433560 [Branchiostoma belcheri]